MEPKVTKEEFVPARDAVGPELKQLGYALVLIVPFIAVFAYGARVLLGNRTAFWLGVGIVATGVIAIGSVVVASLGSSYIVDWIRKRRRD